MLLPCAAGSGSETRNARSITSVRVLTAGLGGSAGPVSIRATAPSQAFVRPPKLGSDIATPSIQPVPAQPSGRGSPDQAELERGMNGTLSGARPPAADLALLIASHRPLMGPDKRLPAGERG